MSHQPTRPTEPAEPIEPPNRRPGTVTLAAALLLLGAVWGLVLAISYFIGSAQVADEFRRRAANIPDATQSQVDTVVALIRSLFSLSGVITLLLAVIIALLAIGILRGSNAARVTAVVLIAIAICSGAGFGSATAFTSRASWTVNVDNADEQLAKDLGQAYSDSMPGWLVGTASGFVCLQLIGYLAVIVLLFLPASNIFFRKRARATSAGGVTMSPLPPSGPGPVPPGAVPPGSAPPPPPPPSV